MDSELRSKMLLTRRVFWGGVFRPQIKERRLHAALLFPAQLDEGIFFAEVLALLEKVF
jgi:hypothetical protein